MRLPIRTVLGLVALYVLALIGLTLWQRQVLADAEAAFRAQVGDPSAPAAISSRAPGLAVLYAKASRRLTWLAVAGVPLIVGIGFLLRRRRFRRSRAVAVALEQALAGRQVPDLPRQDEFSSAVEAAGRVGQELLSVRQRGAKALYGLNAVSQVMDVGVILVTPSREIDFANSLACTLFGCTSSLELERGWAEIRPRFDPALDRVAKGAQGDGSVALDVDLPGPQVPRRLSCQLYRLEEEECDAFLILLRDRAILDSLRTDLILASQLRSLALLYRAITHDLRTPLNSMALNLELLRGTLEASQDIEPEKRDEQRELLGVLRDELGRLNRSLQALMAEAAPTAGAAELLDVRELVRDLERLLRSQARLQSVALASVQADEPVLVAAQRDRLKQAILNVAINALEAMPEGGELTLVTERAEGQAVVSVRDTGPGIPAAVRRRIFDLHFTTKSSGTGIGLFVARSIVESHGGEISVESEEGRGSRFDLRLPAAAKGD